MDKSSEEILFYAEEHAIRAGYVGIVKNSSEGTIRGERIENEFVYTIKITSWVSSDAFSIYVIALSAWHRNYTAVGCSVLDPSGMNNCRSKIAKLEAALRQEILIDISMRVMMKAVK